MGDGAPVTYNNVWTVRTRWRREGGREGADAGGDGRGRFGEDVGDVVAGH